MTIHIRKAVPDDAGSLIEYVKTVAGESNFLTFCPTEFTMTVDEEYEYVKKTNHTPNAVMLVAEVDGRIAGMLSFSSSPKPRLQHIGEMGITVRQEFWNQGIAQKLITALIDWARSGGIIRKINLLVRADNARGIHLYEKMGFQHEGRISRGICVDGQFYDHNAMGLLID